MSELDTVKKKSEKKLATVRTVWPFTLFPDTVIVDENKVTLIYGYPLGRHIFPILIENMNGVRHSEGPLFATLTFEITGYEANPKPIKYLPKRQSRSMQKLISGLITAKKAQIETAELPESELATEAKVIGT